MTCRKFLDTVYLYIGGCIGPLSIWQRLSLTQKLWILNLLGMLIWVGVLFLLYFAYVDANLECAVAMEIRGGEMTALQQAIRDSAEALGFQIVTIEGRVAFHDEVFVAMPMGAFYYNTRWNPPENEKQDRLLLHWLLTKCRSIQYSSNTMLFGHNIEQVINGSTQTTFFNCPPNEFLTRATAAVWAAKEQDK